MGSEMCIRDRFATTIDDGGQRTGSRGRYSPPPSPPMSILRDSASQTEDTYATAPSIGRPPTIIGMFTSRIAQHVESNDPAELQVLKDAFADGGARFLRAYHDVDLAGMNDIPYSRLAVGLALSAAARRLDLSPVMMFAAIPAGTPGVGGYDRVELVQECQRQCRLGKERAVAPVALGASAPIFHELPPASLSLSSISCMPNVLPNA